MLCKNNIHDLLTPADRVGAECRHCHKARQVTYRDRQKLAMALMRQMEASGVKRSDLRANDGFAVALAWCAAADDAELARIEDEYPAMVGKVRKQLERIEAG